MAVLIVFFSVFARQVSLGVYPRELMGYLFLLSLISFIAYGADKYKAVKKRFRTPELYLHLLDLLGGWPGGLLAQLVFRHKISKTSFRDVMVVTVVLNVGVLFYLRMPPEYWSNESFTKNQPGMKNWIGQKLSVLK
ncbi:DUF1294 domain-containing protein [Kiritimatiellaeota bacterium B1221]|nr:DUF1294 domain-containing protein [Kiritimatiellaeota bacterium B1221]